MAAKKIAKSKQRVKVTITLDPRLVKELHAIAKERDESISRCIERHLRVSNARLYGDSDR